MTEEKKPTVSCIIPAHNEGKSILKTLAAAKGVGDALSEILVIDDGSTDDTADIAKTVPGVRLLQNGTNRGKSATIARGIRESSGMYILFLDADLLGLSSDNIASLLRPVVEGRADVVISLRGNTPGFMKRIGVDFMSGERVFPRALLMGSVEDMARVRSFGLEVFLNRIIIANKLRLAPVMMSNVKNDMQWGKRGLFRGLWSQVLLFADVFKTVSPWEWVAQQLALRKLRIGAWQDL